MQAINQFGQFLLRKRLHAGVVALLFALAPIVGIPLIGWLATIVVGLVTLRQGAAEGLIVLCWSAVPAVVMSFVATDAYLLSQVITSGIVVWFLALMLNTRYSWSHLIEIMAWFAIAAILIAHGMSDNIYAFWTAKLNAIVAHYNQVYADDGFKLSLSAKNTYYITHIATGFFVSMVLLNAVFNLLVARWWQARLFNPGGFQREFLGIRLSYRLVITFAVLALLAVLKVEWVLDLFPVVMVAFFVGGFSVMNAWLLHLKHGRILMILFLVLLILRFMFVGVAVMIVAMVDSIVDVRKRWIMKKSMR